MVSTRRSTTKAEPIEDESIVTTMPPDSNSASALQDVDTEMMNNSDADGVNAFQGSAEPEAMQSFGKRSRYLIKAIQKLEGLRIDSTLPSLPKFVVVGDQSHGKSSIIEAVCDVTLPRGSGTCTRCPFQITTTATDKKWNCKISLLQRYSPKPDGKLGWDNTGGQETVHFAAADDKTQLEHFLRLAQVAILNPNLSPAEVLYRNDPNLGNGVEFSPNVVSLEICAPELPEISLFDLPGTINASPDGKQHFVRFIERLVQAYIKDEKALILVAASVDQDLDNSTALKFVQTCKAHDRAMGVLTKPDLATKDRIPHIRRILNGEAFKLHNFWFVTKHLSQEELELGKISHAEARESEKAFFDNVPWSTDLSAFADRFGIANLQNALSSKLTEHILNDLPQITARVEHRLENVNSELAGFPEVAVAPCHTVITEITKLERAITEQLRGESIANEFKGEYRATIKALQKEFQSKKPHVRFNTPGYKQPPISVDSDSDSPLPTTPASSRRKGNDGRATTAAYSPDQSRTRRTPVKTEEGETNVLPEKTIFSLDQIKHAYESGRASDLPESVNYRVTEHLAMQSVASWEKIVDKFLSTVGSIVTKMLSNTIDTALVTRQETKLHPEVKRIIGGLFRRLMDTERATIQKVVSCELHKPITHQTELFKQRVENTKMELHSSRVERRVHEHFDKAESRGLKPVKPDERKKKISDLNWVQSTLGADKYAKDLDCVAEPLTYYDIAAAGLVDVVAKILDCCVLYKLQTELRQHLDEGLKTRDDAHCAWLLADDPAREERRCMLIAEKEKLQQALQELEGLPLLN